MINFYFLLMLFIAHFFYADGQIGVLQFDKQELERYAEGFIENGIQKGGYGYKTANLRELKKMLANIDQKDFSTQVPDFVGISSSNIKTFLKNQGLDVDAV